MALLIECPNCKYGQGLSNNEEKDNPCKRCGTSLSKLRSKTYWIEFYAEGRRKRERIGSNRDLAETVLKKRIVERQEGKLLDKVKKSNFRFFRSNETIQGVVEGQ